MEKNRDTNKNPIIVPLRGELNRLLFISIGVFLFILFFQPFPLDQLKADNRLLYVTGFGGISFILSCILLILVPMFFSHEISVNEWENGPPAYIYILFITLTSTAFSFYIRYAGKTYLTLYIVFKVALICLLPLIILIILYKNKSLERVIYTLRNQNKAYLSRIEENEKHTKKEQVEIISNNKFEKLSLKYKNIIHIKSADNYVVIYYLENDLLEKKMIRNTLKNIEIQLANYPRFIRCHRTSIVNIAQIEKSAKEYGSFLLKMNHLDEKVTVSRQYRPNIIEAISATN